MLNNAPASQQLGNSTQPSYILLKQDGLILTVKSNNISLDSKGKLFICNDSVKAIVTENDGNLTLLLESYIPVSTVKPYIWLPILSTSSYYIKPNSKIGSLDIQCSGLILSNQGHLGWSIFDSQDNLLLAGNDRNSYSKCTYSSTASWSLGNYKLVVREYSPETKQAISYGYKWYRLEQETDSIIDLAVGVVLV